MKRYIFIFIFLNIKLLSMDCPIEQKEFFSSDSDVPMYSDSSIAARVIFVRARLSNSQPRRDSALPEDLEKAEESIKRVQGREKSLTLPDKPNSPFSLSSQRSGRRSSTSSSSPDELEDLPRSQRRRKSFLIPHFDLKLEDNKDSKKPR